MASLLERNREELLGGLYVRAALGDNVIVEGKSVCKLV